MNFWSTLSIAVSALFIVVKGGQQQAPFQLDEIVVAAGDFRVFSHPSFPTYQLRVKSPRLCDPGVHQQAGFLDINDGAHSLFFWFFESRRDPANDPLMLWLNGGPGCSSTTGLFFELGPCSVTDEGRNTSMNPDSWTSVANMIFLDQPVGVGYSYSSDGSGIDNSPATAVDVYAFLQLFLSLNPKFAHLPFHVAAESYGGAYGPNIVSTIRNGNLELIDGALNINLASLILANAGLDPKSEFGTFANYTCDGPYPIFEGWDSPQCKEMDTAVPLCQDWSQRCYDEGSVDVCVNATVHCYGKLYALLEDAKRNPYDVRLACDLEKAGDSGCYPDRALIGKYMNQPYVKRELGVSPDAEFYGCNDTVNQNFFHTGDAMRNWALLLPPLLTDGMRLLVLAGNADAYCNYIGQQVWMESLKSIFQEEFRSTPSIPWFVGSSGNVAGNVRATGGAGAGNYTFIEVLEAGHMAPHDQPQVTLDMITRWLEDLSWD